MILELNLIKLLELIELELDSINFESKSSILRVKLLELDSFTPLVLGQFCL